FSRDWSSDVCSSDLDVPARAGRLAHRPRVYFEEWDEPPITGIRWVSELVGIAGGDDIFPERALEPLAKGRILEDPGEVVRRAPDIIIGSWCGKRFRPDRAAARPGWDAVPAVRDGARREVKSPLTRRPGRRAPTAGAQARAASVHGRAGRRTWARRPAPRTCGSAMIPAPVATSPHR